MSDLVPEGWDTVLLSDLSTKISDGIHSTPKYTPHSEYPFINGNNLKNGRITIGENSKYVSKEEYAKHKKDLTSNTLLMSINGTIGNLAYYCNEEVVLGKSASFISLDKNVSKDFIYYKLASDQVKAFYDFELTGSTISNLSLRSIKNTPITLPPLPEQQKIAAILSSVDEVIEKTQAQINKLKDLKTGMMQELLSPREGQAANVNNPQGESKNGLHHTEFKDSPLGRIPVGWEVAKFKDVFIDYKYGPRFSSKDYSPNGNVKTIRGTDVANNGEVHYQQVPTAQIDADTVEAHKLKDGDLIMITTADCGASAVFREQNIPYIASAYAIKLTPTNKVIPAYIKFFMQTSNAMTQIESFIRKGTVANLPGSDVMNIELALPPIKSQEKISSILNALEDKIDLIIKKNTQLKHTKKALMQDLLTGKVRVQVDAA
jgi:type I restriction enzyme S subunit